MADNDIGKMFLNFMLHDDVHQLCGVDVSEYFPDEKPTHKGKVALCWCHPAMELKPLPYSTVKGILWTEEVVKGDSDNPNNVFCWARVKLSLPGSRHYDPV